FAAAGSRHPNADAAIAPLAAHVETGEGADDPFLEIMDEAAQIGPAPLQVEHDVSHPLAWPVIGVLAASPARMNREPVGLQQVRGRGARPRRVERRVLQQPYQLAGGAAADSSDAGFHGLDGFGIGHRAVGDAPFDRVAHILSRLAPPGPIWYSPSR